MQLTLTIQGIKRIYTASLANTPSTGQLFTRLYYRENIDGRRYLIDDDIKAINAINNMTLHPVEREVEIVISRKTYKLPIIQATPKGFWYIQADYISEPFTEAAKRELKAMIKPCVDAFALEYFEAVRAQAIQRYKEDLHKTADSILLQVQVMKDYADKVIQVK